MENMKEVWFKHITTGARMIITAPSAEIADDEAKKLLVNRKEWTLMGVKAKSQGLMGGILGGN
jgi:hypothetical protein